MKFLESTIDIIAPCTSANKSLMAELQALEERCLYRTVAPSDAPWFEVSGGRVPVLVSAPHACMHYRDGNKKMEEEFTGGIARYLSMSTSCYAIYAVYQANEDPNWQMESAYKRQIARLHQDVSFRFVIDLHGMLNRHGMGVAIGTIHDQSCDSTEIVSAFSQSGFIATELADLKTELERGSAAGLGRDLANELQNGVEERGLESTIEGSSDSDTVNGKESLTDSGAYTANEGTAENSSHSIHRRLVVNHPRFTGGVRNHTVTRFVSEELGVPAVQIELASKARVVYSPPTEDWPQSYTGDEATIASVVAALEALIRLKSS